MKSLKHLIRDQGSALVQCLLKSELFGKVVDRVSYERTRQRRRQIEERLRQSGIYENEVMAGPFKGMRYTSKWASVRFPKIIGAYEHYLHDVVERICVKGYTEIVDVGCAEGYYVTGFARRIPQARIYAYDIESRFVAHCREIAELNGVADRVITGAFCDCAELQKIPVRQKCLVLADCEGYELELLDPARAPMLNRADMFIELHDFKRPGISKTLRERFEKTHEIQLIRTKGFDYENYPILQQLTPPEIHILTDDERPVLMEWFYMQAKA